jgi:hypothetical protein
MIGLTPAQERNRREFIKDMDAVLAAAEAGYCARTSQPQSVRLLTNANISAAIERIQDAAEIETENLSKPVITAAYDMNDRAGAESKESAGVVVLRDVMKVFADRGADRMQSAELVAALVVMEDSPWRVWKNGKPMTAAALARLLKPFGVGPRKLRLGSHTLNGYLRVMVEAAHIRYSTTAPTKWNTGTCE